MFDVERMAADVLAEVRPVLLELLVGQGIVSGDLGSGDATDLTPIGQPVLDRLDLHVVPVGPEGGENATVMRHVPVAVGGTLPDTHRGQMWRLAGGGVPLVDRVVGDAVETHETGAPRLSPCPLDARHHVVGLSRGEDVQVAGGSTGAPGVDTDHDIAVGNPLLRVDDFPVLVDVARPGGDVWVLARHDPPLVRVSVLERQALGVGPV
jgi:hypothetical protein